MQRNAVVDLFWKIHPKLYRFSGGRLLGRLVGMEVLILNTRGRRSGRERSTCLTTFREGGAFVVIGSFLGEPRDPGWVHNLRAQAEATIQTGREIRRVRAHEAEGAERDRLWARLVEIQPEYRDYEGRTDRVIPVVVLDPA
ncbi:MAG: nitroreductase/quinone reductase family protein [Myxococcota bacterium]